MARQEEEQQGGQGRRASGALKTAAAAAATGAASYAVRRAMTRRNSTDESDARAGNETLSAKAAGVKEAAAKLRPTRKSSLPRSAWDAASDYMLPFAREAAAAIGKAAAEKGPDVLRKEIIPRFIDGFEKAR
jgi:hypothetical protein